MAEQASSEDPLGMEDLDVSVGLMNWHLEYESDRVLETAYKYSPEWTQRFEELWARYDDLERRRNAASLDRIWWQDELEGKRKFWLEARDEAYTEMQPQQWRVCPLAVHLDRFLGQDTQDRWFSWKSAQDHWNRFRKTYDDNPLSTDGQVFQASLSAPQQSAYQVLKQWWNSQYHDQEFLSAVKGFLEEQCESPVAGKRYPDFGVHIKCKTHESLYHADCFRLFLAEFHPGYWEPFASLAFLHQLQSKRVSAASHAVTHRIAFAALHPDRRPDDTTHDPLYPRVVLTPDVGFGTSDIQGSPYYLWDVKQAKTIRVNDLPQCPQYTCISHTWGRWAKEGHSVEIDGVPWKVPENERFDVRDLARQFAGLGIAFLWFDLFCINQVDKKERDEEVGRQALIFRGAQDCLAWIFDVPSWDATKAALDWLGIGFVRTTSRLDYEPLDKMRDSIKQAVSRDTGLTLINISNQPQSVRHLQEKMPDFVAQRKVGIEEPSYWFSSLWTLQEAVLCPTIRLFSRDWEELTDRHGHSITLVSLVQFIHHAVRACQLITTPPLPITVYDPDKYNQKFEILSESQRMSWMRWPTGPQQLQRLIAMTRMDNLLITLSPAAVFMNANLRTCGGLRAEAIMSAIGVLDWFHESSATKDILFNSYPLTFVREAALKSGAIFYEPSTGVIESEADLEKALHSKQPVGSMMPFTEKKGWFSKVIAVPEWSGWDLIDHECVREWQIQRDASVRIKKAGIMASYPPIDPKHDNDGKSLDVEGVFLLNYQPPQHHQDQQQQKTQPPNPNATTTNIFKPHLSLQHQQLQAATTSSPPSSTPTPRTGSVTAQTTFRTLLHDLAPDSHHHKDQQQYRVFAVALYTDQRDQHGIILLGPRRTGRRWGLGGDSSSSMLSSVGVGKQYLVKIGSYTAFTREMPSAEPVNWVVL